MVRHVQGKKTCGPFFYTFAKTSGWKEDYHQQYWRFPFHAADQTGTDDGVGAIVNIGEGDFDIPAKVHKEAERIDADPAGYGIPSRPENNAGTEYRIRNSAFLAVVHDQSSCFVFPKPVRIKSFHVIAFNFASFIK